MQLPLLHFSTMAENLFDVIGQAKVKGHDAGWIDLHIGDIAAASVLPRRLPWQDQVSVIYTKDCRENEEKKEEHDEDHVDSLNVVPLPPYRIHSDVRVVNHSLRVAIKGKI